MIELKIDNDRIEKCKIDGCVSATLAELFIGASALYEKVKELFEDED